jgi:hypothetical protein
MTEWLPRLHRAGPSTSLDKSAIRGYTVVIQDDTTGRDRCQIFERRDGGIGVKVIVLSVNVYYMLIPQVR